MDAPFIIPVKVIQSYTCATCSCSFKTSDIMSFEGSSVELKNKFNFDPVFVYKCDPYCVRCISAINPTKNEPVMEYSQQTGSTFGKNIGEYRFTNLQIYKCTKITTVCLDRCSPRCRGYYEYGFLQEHLFETEKRFIRCWHCFHAHKCLSDVSSRGVSISKSYKTMTIKDLKSYCSELGVSIKYNTKRSEIVKDISDFIDILESTSKCKYKNYIDYDTI